MDKGKMIGRHCPDGPGGRDCYCCGQPPGKGRKVKRRSMKRGERNKMRQEMRNHLS